MKAGQKYFKIVLTRSSASSTLTFTFETAPAVGTYVSQLQLVNASGQPLSSPITTSPSISGQVASDANAVGVTVELDTNGDGVADLTTTTDGQGKFRRRKGRRKGVRDEEKVSGTNHGFGS